MNLMPGFNARKHRYKKVAKIDAVVPKINEIHKNRYHRYIFKAKNVAVVCFFRTA